ncbi:serpin family protein [Lysinibacillus sp. 54212]|uniref:serpin family protein n=1 Tax=Lysinibacillus sp. 54212 TaxID=3119829 RepID=UPI002FCBF5EA
MLKKLVAVMSMASLMLIAAGCGQQSKGLEVSSNAVYDKDDYKKIVSANNGLGFRLLPEVNEDEHGNRIISPMSLYMALSMVYNGADGRTQEEIAKALQVKGIAADDLNEANASLLSMLHRNSEQVQLYVANSVWLNTKYRFQKDFSKKVSDYFNAALHEIDIKDSQSANKINDWVKESTNSKIEHIVNEPLSADLAAILINTMYFKGQWTNEFEKKNTTNRPFYLADGTKKEVPLMKLEKKIAYLENDHFQAVSLPYGEDEKMSMKIFLPREGLNLEDFQKLLTNKHWQQWSSGFIKKQGTVLLPKFKLEYEVAFKEPLQELGIHEAFGAKANFSKMIEEKEPFFISEVKQKTFIDVNEKGTEAAAATSVTVKTGGEPATPFQMEVNRPFFVAITDDTTDIILFMGTIANPQQGE